MKKEVKIGLVTVVAVLIVYFGILFLKNIRLASANNIYYIEMADVNGLSPQAEVLASGMNVGTVKSLSFDAKRQLVVVAVDLIEGYVIPVGTTATLTKDMLGSPKVKLMLGSDSSRLLSVGDTITGFPMTDLMASAGDMIPSVEALLPKLDSILTALNTMVNNPALSATIDNLQQVSAELRVSTKHLNTLLQGDVPLLVSRANVTLGNLEHTTGEIRKLDIAGMSARVDDTMRGLQLFTNRLNNENSSLGKLMNDDAVYNELDSTLQNAKLLLEDLRLNPKRYVHFSVFPQKK